MSKMLGPVALVLAVVALAVNFAIPGPSGSAGVDGTNGTNGTNGATGAQGPQGLPGPQGPSGTNGTNGALGLQGPPGPQGPGGTNGTNGAPGPQGPAGPGTVANYSVVAPWQSGGQLLVGCTNIMTIGLTVPSAGYVIVIATVHVWIEHIANDTDTWAIVESATGPTDCADTDPTRNVFFQEISEMLPADGFMNMAGSVVNTFPVGAAGAYTFYVNAMMFAGESAGDGVSEASSVAIFFPS